MDNDIEIVPALKRLELKNIGCWEDLSMEFLPGLNVITEEDGGLGKSTILRAIIRALHPSARMQYPVSPTSGNLDGEISAELMYPTIKISIKETKSAPLDDSSERKSSGQLSLELLRSCIEEATPHTAILIDADVTSILNSVFYAEAVELLNASTCQIICVIPHRLDPNQHKQARIYTCYWDQENDQARIRLHQSGEVGG